MGNEHHWTVDFKTTQCTDILCCKSHYISHRELKSTCKQSQTNIESLSLMAIHLVTLFSFIFLLNFYRISPSD